MATLFLSVDVEATGPSPVVADLLTVGAVGVLADGTVLEDQPLYFRLRHERPLRWNPDTWAWWESQDPEVRRLAYGAWRPEDGPHISARDGALMVDAWLSALLERTGCDLPCFVAHPVGFDWAYINALMWEQLQRNPFGYRSLCLRSMGFGLSDEDWGRDRTDDPDLYVAPTLPHHALHDAVAQAHMLARLLARRRAA